MPLGLPWLDVVSSILSGFDDIHFSPLAFFNRLCVLSHLSARKRPTLKFTLGLEPVVQLKAWRFTTFEINFVRAKSDFFVARHFPNRNLSRLRLGGGT